MSECDKYNESEQKQCYSKRWNFHPEASNLHEVIHIKRQKLL